MLSEEIQSTSKYRPAKKEKEFYAVFYSFQGLSEALEAWWRRSMVLAW